MFDCSLDCSVSQSSRVTTVTAAGTANSVPTTGPISVANSRMETRIIAGGTLTRPPIILLEQVALYLVYNEKQRRNLQGFRR